ncbi:hypothetical protein N7509_007771 [Penicillium cosmopolitanum]|uniref:Uncharacterized protein n=1 Tax=Penicillium cosmopolitanum TaxID=1131564 RepID=A0A9W9VZN7_9EURO|nr:uncharacterized protein N7509_007771 [Penicillium cosmopolitanum]KAJ5392281.1 hypothetical protein N7509_007771 [Penicillium cosmopolitanum]
MFVLTRLTLSIDFFDIPATSSFDQYLAQNITLSIISAMDENPCSQPSSVYGAALVLCLTLVLRILMAENRFDEPDAGLIPLFAYFFRHFWCKDPDWGLAYTTLRTYRVHLPLTAREVRWRKDAMWTWFLTILQFKKVNELDDEDLLEENEHKWAQDIADFDDTEKLLLDPATTQKSESDLILVYGRNVISIPDGEALVPDLEELGPQNALCLTILVLLLGLNGVFIS